MELRDLKVGDKVIVHERFCADSIGIIEKITPKASIKVGNVLYNPNDGSKRSSNVWTLGSISVATSEQIETIEKNEFCYKFLRKLNRLTSIDYDKALEINKIMEWDNNET